MYQLVSIELISDALPFKTVYLDAMFKVGFLILKHVDSGNVLLEERSPRIS